MVRGRVQNDDLVGVLVRRAAKAVAAADVVGRVREDRLLGQVRILSHAQQSTVSALRCRLKQVGERKLRASDGFGGAMRGERRVCMRVHARLHARRSIGMYYKCCAARTMMFIQYSIVSCEMGLWAHCIEMVVPSSPSKE